MNKLATMFYALAAIASMSMPSAHAAAPGLNQPHDWTIEIRTKEMPLHFEYQGSTLRPLVKADLKFWKMSDEDNKKAYQYLWYANGKTLGLERKGKLTITEGDAIGIKVVHDDNSPVEEERRAAGKAIMRAVLDAQINHNMIAAVKVPIGSFNSIIAEIQNYNFHPASESPNEELHSDMNLFIESEPEGLKQTLYHFN